MILPSGYNRAPGALACLLGLLLAPLLRLDERIAEFCAGLA